MTPMQPSQACFDLIKQFEGCRLTAYQDSVKVWTIGYGHTKSVCMSTTITQEKADEFLRSDVQDAVDCVNRKIGPQPTQHEFDAMVSFVFNLGCYNFSTSTLVRLMNAGEHRQAAEEFLKWNHAGKEVLEGLTRRRRAERKLFLGVAT